MKKRFVILLSLVLTLVLVSCGKNEKVVSTTEIDTGIPDVVMMIEDNLTEDEYADIGDNRVLYINSDGKSVEYRRMDTDGNIELEKYYSYHSDGRLYQELVKIYDNGELYLTEMRQYEYTKNSKDAVVTIWEKDHINGRFETDSVVCTMSTEESDLYCSAFQSNPLKIRGLTEYHYGMKLDYIDFIAGIQIND